MLGDRLLRGLPVDAVRRVRQHVVEALTGKQVIGEGVAAADVRRVLALRDHVRLADRVRLRVDLLAVQPQPRIRVHGEDALLGDREHAARAGCRVVDAADDAGIEDAAVVALEQQVDHQPDRVARREVLTRGLVRRLRELADERLEEVAHLGIRDAVGVEIDVGELLHHEQQPVVLGHGADLVLELELLEDVDLRREPCDEVDEVIGESVGILHELRERPAARVGETEARLLADQGIAATTLGVRGNDALHRFMRALEHGVEATQDRHRQDDVAVLMRLVNAAQLIGDLPDEVAESAHLVAVTSWKRIGEETRSGI
ncbi:hypothetical protein GCM10025869_25320 [Homoserinibacter gongjuensis]|uniref:Uncharacterized protein n=1 Tax=Homoserinibacter gongjuensis TaxID=1162968 RepID=A0ABQ6JUZ4_9MICO|nr:hypothetical protein GCM10025869_25320 [Homoserinibacter gongjuensis]